MAFELPTMPNFNVQTPDIIGAQQKTMALKQMLAEQAMMPQRQELLSQQVQQAKTQNQMQQIALQAEKGKAAYWADPDKYEEGEAPAQGASNISTALGLATGDPVGRMIRGMIRAGVPGPAAVIDAKAMIDMRRTANQATQEEQKVHENALNELTKLSAPVLAEKDPLKKSVLLAEAKQGMLAAAKYDPVLSNIIPSLTPENFNDFANRIGAAKESWDYLKAQAAAKKEQQGVISESGGMSPETQQQVFKDVAVGTNPQIQAGKEAVAAAEGRAKAQIEHEFATKNNAALSSVPTHLVGPATEAAQKANKEWADAKSVIDRMSATMDAAKKGNVVSYQIIPQEGTLQLTTSQGVHRINRTEIEQYAGGGSLWQRLEGHLGKALTGKSIPDSVMQDMAEIQDIQAKGAKSRYENTLKSINQTYGSSFKSVEMQGLGGKPESGKMGGNAVTVTAPNGKTYSFPDQASADAFKKKAGIS
jgi:hypothetical protein